MKSLIVSVSFAALFAAAAPAATPPKSADDAAVARAAAHKLAESVKYATGDITLAGGVARISIPEGFRYVNPADTVTVLNKLWGNPGDDQTLGMIVPNGFDPLGDGNWAAVLTFVEDGYVKDDDAAKIDYTELLKQMQEGATEANKEREKAGYPPVALIGWAAPPRYDASTHKLYWAKELEFGDSTVHTLNYNIRMLGRRGVLVVNVVAEVSQLKQVEAATSALLSMVNFQEGHRYADFAPDTDKVATYGLAALVAGGVAAKAGLFKMLWVGLLAFKKLIFLAFIAAASQFKKLWAWIRGRIGGSAGENPPTAT